MNKVLIYLVMLVLVGCAEKKEYEQAVAEQMKQENEIKDYKIEPEEMIKCVVETTSSNMPGIFAFDPDRLTAYKNYTKMLKLNSSPDPKKTLEELRTDFGDGKKLAEAHANYAESVVNCMTGLVTSSEQTLTSKKEQVKQ